MHYFQAQNKIMEKKYWITLSQANIKAIKKITKK